MLWHSLLGCFSGAKAGRLPTPTYQPFLSGIVKQSWAAYAAASNAVDCNGKQPNTSTLAHAHSPPLFNNDNIIDTCASSRRIRVRRPRVVEQDDNTRAD